MLTFLFCGAIADIDELTDGEGVSATKLLILQIGEKLERIELPEELFRQVEAMLCAGRIVTVQGEIKSSTEGVRKIAASLRFTDPGH